MENRVFNLKDPKKFWWWFDLLLLTLLCGSFFSLFLGSYPLIDPDEGRYSDVTRHMVLTGNFLIPMINGIPFFDKPVLFYWLQSIPLLIFRMINEWTLRAWPAVAATITCLYTYITARKCFNRRTAWFASLILATSSLFFLMAHFANLDLTTALFISLSLFSLLLVTEGQQGFCWLAYLFAGFAVLSKGLIGLVFPIMIMGLWIILLNHWKILKRMHLFSGFIIIAVITLPWFIVMEYRYHGFLYYFFYAQQVQRYLANHFNDHEAMWFYPQLIVLGMFPWTIYFIFALVNKIKKVWTNRSQQSKYLFLLIWIISITLFFSIPASKTAGYILPIFPAAALLTAAYLDQYCTQTTFSGRLLILFNALCLLFLAVALPFISFFNTHLTPVRFELYLAAFILLISAIGLFVVYFIQVKLFQSMLLTGIAGIALLIIFMFAMAHHAQNLGVRTSKPLALQLRPLLKPTDIVVFYHFYYQDLPIYLNRPILLVAGKSLNADQDKWQHDFYQGLRYPTQSDPTRIILTDSQFAKLWQSKETVYAFILQSKLIDLEKIVHPAYRMGRYANLVLVSNYPAQLAREIGAK